MSVICGFMKLFKSVSDVDGSTRVGFTTKIQFLLLEPIGAFSTGPTESLLAVCGNTFADCVGIKLVYLPCEGD